MNIFVRSATVDDVSAIVLLIAQNARKGGLLPRGEASIRAHIGNFLIAVQQASGAESMEGGESIHSTLHATPSTIVGCGSLLPMNATLVELRSLAVDENIRGAGIGQKIVVALIAEAKTRKFGTLFALTRAVGFFEKCGFVVAPKEFFPEKVWNDCVQCPMLENCDEVAVMMSLGQIAIEEQPTEERDRVLRAVQAGRLARRAVSRENLIPLENVSRMATEAHASAPTRRAAPKRDVQKVVLAYNGGLDSSAIVPWLIEHYGCEVICFIADIGQREDFEALKQKALDSGASKVIIKDLRDEFANEYLFPLIQSGAIYENKYLLGSSISRPLIAKHQVDVATQEGADALAHGATGKGNDQVRFELAYMAMNPKLRVIAPWREWSFDGRGDVYEYARSRGIPLGEYEKGLYTLDENLWHFNHEGGRLEDLEFEPDESLWEWTNAIEETPDEAEYVELEFVSGMPKRLNGKAVGNAALIEQLNEIGATHGIGRVDIVENRLVGMKSRALDEAPGGTILARGASGSRRNYARPRDIAL